MSTTITADGTTFPAAVAPLADVDPRSVAPGSAMYAGLKASADRTQHLFEALAAIDPTKGGARTLLTLASVAALEAFAGQRDGDVAIVPELGVYLFDASSSSPATPAGAGPRLTVAPRASAVGRWRLTGAGVACLGVPYGLPLLVGDTVPTTKLEATKGAGGRLRQDALAGGLLQLYTASDVGDAGFGGGDNDRALPQLTAVSVPVAPGDVLHYRAAIEALVGVGEVIQAYTVVTTPAGVRILGGVQSERPYDGKDLRKGLFLERHYIAREAGVHKVEVFGKTIGNVGAVTFAHGYVAFELTAGGG